MNVETFLDNLFAEGAKQEEDSVKGKTYQYSADNTWYKHPGFEKSGRCVITRVNYNKTLDCNVYYVKDIDTEEEFSIDQFSISLKEIEG